MVGFMGQFIHYLPGAGIVTRHTSWRDSPAMGTEDCMDMTR